MIIRANLAAAPKAGCEPSSNDDAVFQPPDLQRNRTWARFAVADGATSTIYSGRWASAIAESFWRSGSHWINSVDRLAAAWQEEANSRAVAWNFRAKILEGSDTTLCGACVRETNRGIGVELITVGDTCAFRIAIDGVVTAAFPITDPAAFSDRPQLVSTLARHRTALTSHIRTQSWVLDAGERLVLATDAASGWLLTQPPDAVARLLRIVEDDDEGEFRGWVDEERARFDLKDDDTTVLVVNARPNDNAPEMSL